MTSNNLKLNGCKSEFMLLGSKGMLSKVTTPSFKTDDVTLEPKESCRNLGVIFDIFSQRLKHAPNIPDLVFTYVGIRQTLFNIIICNLLCEYHISCVLYVIE